MDSFLHATPLGNVFESDDATTSTTLLDGMVQINQPEKGFRAGIDTVFVAAYADIKSGDKVLDMGCGVGGAGLCAAQRRPKIAALHGMEVDGFYAQLAQENYNLNNAPDGTVFHQDIRVKADELAQKYDYIICNPPYMMAGHHRRSHDPSKARAMGQGEGEASLEDWVKAFRFYLKNGGGVSIIQRADMLDVMITLLKGAFGAIEVLPLFSKQDSAEAKRVLIRAVKGRKTPFRMLRPLIVHKEDGSYMPEIETVLRKAAALPPKL